MLRASRPYGWLFILSTWGQLACDSAGNPQAPSAPAPEHFRVRFETTKGDFIVAVSRDWSPRGADRFYELVKSGFYDGCAFFRVVKGVLVQFGINGDPAVTKKWRGRSIPDDLARNSNHRGYLSFAKSTAPNSRSTQVFVNCNDNSADLDVQGFSPFGRVIEGMEVVDSINAEYRGEPDQARIEVVGNEYLQRAFPRLDYVKKAVILEE